MFAWFDALNPSLQGVVIGSTLSIAGTTIGVVLTNAFNLWTLRKQQTHDRAQKSLERVATLRRTVYLEAVEALGAGLSLVARQGHLGVADADLLEPFHSRAPNLAKVYLTAKEGTAIALAKYSAEFQKSLTGLTLQRNKAVAGRQRILDIRKNAESQRNLADEMIELQKRWYIAADPNREKHTAMGHAAEYHTNQATALAKQADELVPPLKLLHLELFEASQREHLRLAKELFPFIVAIRDELESPVDSERFSEIFNVVKPIPRDQLEKLLGM